METIKTIDRNELKERLINCGYIAEYGLDRTVDNLLNLKNIENKDAYNMLVEWMETGKLKKFEPIEGINLKFLRDTLRMKDPAVILAYGMLLYDAKRNAVFLKRQVDRRNVFSVPAKRK